MSSSSSCSSDSDDIEIDGFPPENAVNARFISLKSNNDSLTNQKLFRPISSWNDDTLPDTIINTCVRVLTESTNLTENEKQIILEQLEGYSLNNLNMETSCQIKPSAPNFKSLNMKHEISKYPAIKVNVEIPSMDANSNNIKYSIDKPVYDNAHQCWKTSMDFILHMENDSSAIFENSNEVYKDDKETQTDNTVPIRSNTFTSINRQLSRESRSKSEEKLIFTDLKYIQSLETRINVNADICLLEKIENTLGNEKEKLSVSQIKSSYKNYKHIIQSNIDQYNKELKRISHDCDSILNDSYEKLTEYQFKWNAKNQVILLNVDKEISILNTNLHRTSEIIKRLLKSNDKNENTTIHNEVKKIKLTDSVKLITQMIANLKHQVTTLKNEIYGKSKPTIFKLKF